MPPNTTLATQLKDIKPPVVITDWSFYLYWGVILLGGMIVLIALYYLVKLLMEIRHTNQRRTYLSALKEIQWNDPKKAAYEATRLGRLILSDDERLQELYRQMTAELDHHKYRKEVDPLTPEARRQFDLFVKACDESL